MLFNGFLILCSRLLFIHPKDLLHPRAPCPSHRPDPIQDFQERTNHSHLHPVFPVYVRRSVEKGVASALALHQDGCNEAILIKQIHLIPIQRDIIQEEGI